MTMKKFSYHDMNKIIKNITQNKTVFRLESCNTCARAHTLSLSSLEKNPDILDEGYSTY